MFGKFLETAPCWGLQLSGVRLKISEEPLDSYGSAPQAGSGRNGTTAISSAVAHLPEHFNSTGSG